MDERHWLMGTAYNTGIECLQFVARQTFSADDPTHALVTHAVRHFWTRRRGGSRRQRASVAACQMARLAQKRWDCHQLSLS